MWPTPLMQADPKPIEVNTSVNACIEATAKAAARPNSVTSISVGPFVFCALDVNFSDVSYVSA